MVRNIIACISRWQNYVIVFKFYYNFQRKKLWPFCTLPKSRNGVESINFTAKFTLDPRKSSFNSRWFGSHLLCFLTSYIFMQIFLNCLTCWCSLYRTILCFSSFSFLSFFLFSCFMFSLL